jgi:hypothetical protein
MAAKIGSTLRRRPGRPRKFAAPSRAVTVTLPDDVIEVLRGVDQDVSRAVARIAARHQSNHGRPAAELSVFGRRAVITVRPTPTLERRTGISLVPLTDGRALISFDQPTTIEELELLLYDALEDPHLAADDRRLFQEIASILKHARRSRDVTLLRRTIIVLESPRAMRLMHGRSRRQ